MFFKGTLALLYLLYISFQLLKTALIIQIIGNFFSMHSESTHDVLIYHDIQWRPTTFIEDFDSAYHELLSILRNK